MNGIAPHFAAALLAACALSSPAAAAEPKRDDSALESMVAAERAFAKLSVEQGMKTAFVENLADDGILFRGGPVNGMRLFRSRPASDVVLDWAPSFAEMSGSGDFGFTYGPWTFSASPKEKPAAFGHFVTVWRKDREGRWKVAVDIGVSHDDPGTALDRVTLARGPYHAKRDSTEWRKWGAGVGVGVQRGNVGVGVGTGGVGIGLHSGGLGFGFGSGGVRSRLDYEWRRTAHEKNELMSEERRLAFEARTRGWESAYRKVAANDLRFFRANARPDLGIEAAVEGAAHEPRNREFVSRGNGVAPSWDLGYAYGIAVSRREGAPADTASYVHLYRKDDAGKWKLMLDVEEPFPKRTP